MAGIGLVEIYRDLCNGCSKWTDSSTKSRYSLNHRPNSNGLSVSDFKANDVNRRHTTFLESYMENANTYYEKFRTLQKNKSISMHSLVPPNRVASPKAARRLAGINEELPSSSNDSASVIRKRSQTASAGSVSSNAKQRLIPRSLSSSLRLPPIQEENRSPSSIEDVGNTNQYVNATSTFIKHPEKGSIPISACRGSCEVTLRRKAGDTLGLGIAGGADKGCPPTVSCLRPGGIAHRSDCLQVGDLLISVNGVAVNCLKHEDILTVLRNAGEQVVLSVEYDLNHPCFDRPPIGSTITKTCLVKLQKEGGCLGLTIRGGAYGPDASKSRSLTVTAIRAGSPAHRDGRIRIGDRLTAINGFDVTTTTLRHALSHIDRSNECVITMDYDVSVLEAVNNARGPLLLEIDKPAGEELGVTLNVEEIRDDQSAPTRRIYVIGAIISASIADRCGALFVGDQLLAVDGVTLEYTTLAELYQLLKGSSNSQNIRVEIIPRYLRGSKLDQPPVPRQSSKENGLPEYAVVTPNGQRGKNSERRPSVLDATVARSTSKPTSNGSCNHQSAPNPKSQQSKNSSNCQCPNGNGHDSKKSPDKDLRHQSMNGRGRKLVKQASMYTTPQSITTASAPEKSKKTDRRHSSATSKTAQNGRGRSASTVGARHGTPVHDIMPLSSGSLTASVSTVPCGQVCHTEVMEVVLNCWARGGYGLILHRNQQSTADQQRSPLFVSYIERGSPADKSGVLQIGDRILAINDWCTSNGTPEEANYLVRHSTGPLTLTIEFDVIETVLPSSGVFTVKLAKRGQNLGIVLQPSASSQKGDTVIISDIRTGSVAHRCGTIHAGDQILAIDNIPLDTCTMEEASRLLQRSSEIVKLRIKKNVDDYSDTNSTGNGSQTIVYTVELNRKNGPLGLGLAGSSDRFDPIFVNQLTPDGLVNRTGAVRIGDRLIAINGQSLHGKRVCDAIKLLEQSGDTVSLKVARHVAPNSSSTPAATPSNDPNHSRSLFHTNTSMNHHGQDYLPQLVTLSERHMAFHDQFNERISETCDKLGTPVQSIDSAVESLEDSPLNDSQHPCTSSNRTSQNSKSSSLSGNGGGQAENNGPIYPDDLSSQLHRTLSAIKTNNGGSSSGTSQGSRQSDPGSSNVSNANSDEDPHYAQLGGETCPCQNHQTTGNGDSQDDWIRVLEALETVGEAEMLRKLEESIMAGTVPQCASGTSTNDHAQSSTSQSNIQKPPPKPILGPPFPMTNTILRHPYSHLQRNVNASSSAEKQSNNGPTSILKPLTMSLSSTFGSNSDRASPPSTSRPLSISTIFSGYEHIPFITTPVPASATPKSATQSSASATSANYRSDRPDSPIASIQLSSPAESAVEYGQTNSTNTPSNRPSASGQYSSGTGPRVPLEIYRVTLFKDHEYNDFGFSLSEGAHVKGFFVRCVRNGSPADLAGMKRLDRILQVNGTSLENLDSELAVGLLKAANDRVDILICRDPTLLINLSIEEEDEDEIASLIGQTTV